jgi:hypothetical protein
VTKSKNLGIQIFSSCIECNCPITIYGYTVPLKIFFFKLIDVDVVPVQMDRVGEAGPRAIS